MRSGTTRHVVRGSPALLLVVVLGACGGGDGHGDAGRANAPVERGARSIDVDARSFEFDPSEIEVDAGEDVAVVLHSEDQTHDFVIEGKGHVVETEGGKTATGGFTLAKAGKYTFYCSLPGHRAAGMEGTITAR
jgi:plastocyanin